MTEEERQRMEYWQRQQAEENARAFWRNINEPWMLLAVWALRLGVAWIVVANGWIYRVEITSWIVNHLLLEGAVTALVLGVVATLYFYNRLDRDIKQQAAEAQFVERCNQTPNDLPPGWEDSLNAGGYVQDRSGQWVKRV